MGKEIIICRKCGKVIQETIKGKDDKVVIKKGVHQTDCSDWGNVKADQGPTG